MDWVKKITWLLLAVTGAAFLILFLPLKWGIWLPDVTSGRTIVLDEFTATNGDQFRLIQRWVGDGYLTELQHTNQRGREWWFTIHGDAMKSWKGRIHRINDSTIEVQVLGDSFLYNMHSHVGTDSSGEERWILEKPEDGSAAFLVERNMATNGESRRSVESSLPAVPHKR